METICRSIPAHLVEPITTGLKHAQGLIDEGDGEYDGYDLTYWAEKWDVEWAHGAHLGGLTPEQANSLLAVLEIVAEYAENNNYGSEADREQFPEDYAFAHASEEILLTLQDIVGTRA
jgi:hypothetical protein